MMQCKQVLYSGVCILLVAMLCGCSLFKAEDKWLRQDEPSQARSQETVAVSREYKNMIETWLGFKLPRGTKAQYASQMGAYEENLYMRFDCTDAALLATLEKMHLKNDLLNDQFAMDEYTKWSLKSYVDQGLFGAVPAYDKDVFSKEIATSRNTSPAKADVYLVRMAPDHNMVMIHISMY